ncbi:MULTISPECIES: MBL fold metallo-hydrolase [unclassified Arthrobacter]|uniref:MBL fold metallo-hydrolase n=1 Tax=unclassified Arthrobacter TaxID=235627 RepID=UPI001E2A04E8|nr:MULTISPECIES: MBL fold metallo-hydrolase [unclassified Arthrobacter]MCC9146632.1 MBL fold metallo-hydrolase [Arthrobacter sp. zg-Y919]MDK1277862.1 MBL fold metallo-hydrolase [Arthrobacter sp. zg.Y919]WIB02188.1 MBL fold metallo-hydrolase [Arthrobacter sp. zg-Y919]
MSTTYLPDSGLVRSSDLTRVRLAPNPGPMSLDGTNSYVVAAPGSESTVVVDPGPQDEGHLRALAEAGTVELVLITHRHADHTEASRRFAELTGAPVRAFDPAFCVAGSPLTADEEISAAGVDIRVLAAPGHTSDSVCFLLPDDGANGSVLTGDTILGRGTTVLDFPDGTLDDYLRTLDMLSGLGPAVVLPGHGPVQPDLSSLVLTYRDHREERLEQIRSALHEAGPDAGAGVIADLVYSDVPANVRRAAELSVAAQLAYLRGEG